MSKDNEQAEVRITIDSGEAAVLFGQYDENLRFLEAKCRSKIIARGGEILIQGSPRAVEFTRKLFTQLIELVRAGNSISLQDIGYAYHLVVEGYEGKLANALSEIVITTSRGKPIRAKTLGQQRYLQAIREHDIVFGIGPAGTGKTYLAVVMAIQALRNKDVNRIVLVRPAVEAGEKLGFLPGDLQEKVNPYLRPLYDGLYDTLGLETAQRYMEKGVIEIAPLAYMRGRTLNDSFIILDEAQNTTPEQMKMFLTRLGFGSKAVITGDITQVDLPKDQDSGLVVIQRILDGIEGISFQYLTTADVVRHPLIQNIIKAYERYEEEAKPKPPENGQPE